VQIGSTGRPPGKHAHPATPKQVWSYKPCSALRVVVSTSCAVPSGTQFRNNSAITNVSTTCFLVMDSEFSFLTTSKSGCASKFRNHPPGPRKGVAVFSFRGCAVFHFARKNMQPQTSCQSCGKCGHNHPFPRIWILPLFLSPHVGEACFANMCTG
jgi:hypothetical protein